MNVRLATSPPLNPAHLAALFEAAWPERGSYDLEAVKAQSLAYVCAFEAERLIGFLNLAWDGGAHAFLLDTTVHPAFRRRGIGTKLVTEAVSLARVRGLEWVHVDYEPRLTEFYTGCGFRQTAAGVFNLSVSGNEPQAVVRPLPDRVETERLVLRGPRLTDAPVLFASYTQDPAVARFTTWRPHTSEPETKAFVSDLVNAWDTGARLPYVLTWRSQETAIGILEARLKAHTVDIGYVLARPFWGQGLMSEAIRGLVRMVFEAPGLFRIQATCDIENNGSFRALEKAGFIREGRLERHTVHPNISPEPRACFMYARCR